MVTRFGKETTKILHNFKITVSGLSMLSEVYHESLILKFIQQIVLGKIVSTLFIESLDE